MSRVMCHVSNIIFFVDKAVKLVVGGSVLNGAYPVYHYNYNEYHDTVLLGHHFSSSDGPISAYLTEPFIV